MAVTPGIPRNMVVHRPNPVPARPPVPAPARPIPPAQPRHITDIIQKAKERAAATQAQAQAQAQVQPQPQPAKPIILPPPPIVQQATKNAVVYIFPAYSGTKHWQYAIRFLYTYVCHPPEADHISVIVLNGAKVSDDIRRMFSVMPNVTFIEHDDSGWDIGGYQKASRQVSCDLMAFFGGSTYFRGRGWLRRMQEAYQKHGPALYGCMGNRGDAYVKVEPHIRTTGFWMPPALFNEFPYRVTQHSQRYEFEHGKTCLTNWIRNTKQLKAWVVTWTGEYLWENWDNFANGMHRGDQSALMVGDRLTEPPFFPKLCLT